MITQSKAAAWLAVAALLLSVEALVAGMDVKVGASKTFDFTKVRTWDWNPRGTGEVKMARTQQDDPDAMHASVDPIIVAAAVEQMKTKRGIEQQASKPDVVLNYYLLLTTGQSAQVFGQFLPATTAWGVPPFLSSTQSLQMMNEGALVFDFSAGDTVVWRGVAQAKIKPDAATDKRTALLREAVRDLLKKFPPS